MILDTLFIESLSNFVHGLSTAFSYISESIWFSFGLRIGLFLFWGVFFACGVSKT